MATDVEGVVTMLCIEVRGGVVVAAYSDESAKITVVDYDNGKAHCVATESTRSIPDDALKLLRQS
jgi:hypothetical protein